MPLIAHKYMPAEIDEEELKATFAARQHTLDYLVKSLRDQVGAETLTSYLITGPRGAGKTTLILMLCLRLNQDPVLRAAWLPVRFPEELPAVTSLRDLLVRALHVLAEEGLPEAREWQEKAEDELDEEQSEELAITGLRQVAEREGKRLILLVENLDLVFKRGLDDDTKATLRRLLMTDPFMMVVGSAVRVFPELRDYDEAFFNYFCPVALETLNEEQVHEVLSRRAEWDGNEQFEQQYRKHRPKIRAISLLTGGNPRFLLMVYEVLTTQNLESAVRALRNLVDELTPLLKDIIEHQLTKQQVKIVDALMQLDGKATPSQIAEKARFTLNTVTTQLKRLEEAKMVELHGGGKGRPAWYTIPDRLFYTWYQMRYLRRQRRRIELFVEVLQVWFEAEERLEALRSLSSASGANGAKIARGLAESAEYFAASLEGTEHRELARELAIRNWLRVGDVGEAVASFAEFYGVAGTGTRSPSANYIGLSAWLREHGDLESAIKVLESRMRDHPDDLRLRGVYGLLLGLSGDRRAPGVYDQIMAARDIKPDVLARALLGRGIVRGMQGDTDGEVEDYTAVIELEGAPRHGVAIAMYDRGVRRGEQGDREGAIADYTAVVELEGVPTDLVAQALFGRGVIKGDQGDMDGEIEDYTAVVELERAPTEWVAEALINRGVSKGTQGDTEGAIADFTAVIELEGAPTHQVAKALLGCGVLKAVQGGAGGAIAHFTAVVELEGAPTGQVAQALVNRGVSKGEQGDREGAIADYSAVVELEGAPKDRVAQALFSRGVSKGKLGDTEGEIADYTAVVELEGAPKDQVARALFNRGASKDDQGETEGAIADYTAVTELEDGPREPVLRAMLYRGLAQSMLGRSKEALRDWEAVIAAPEADEEIWLRAATEALRVAWLSVDRGRTDEILASVLSVMARQSPETGRKTTTKLFSGLAAPDMRSGWPHAWRRLSEGLPDQVVQIFQPIADILETGDLSKLDPLPPEQREFVEGVLKKFEPGEQDES